MTTSRTFQGVPASPGVATGRAVVLAAMVAPVSSSAASEPVDPRRAALQVEEALDRVADDLRALADRLRDRGKADEAEIVGVGALIAGDPALRAEARREAGDGRAPAEAVTLAADRYAAAIAAIGDPVLAERAADVRQVGRRAAALLNEVEPRSASNGSRPSGGTILLAEELGPADILGMEEGEIVAAAAVRGGPNAHAAIVARSLGLPLVLGLDPAVLGVGAGTALVVDGDAGSVTVAPRDDELSAARHAMDSAARRRSALAAERDLPSETTDGLAVTLLCNVATAPDTRAGLEAGAEGVGLLRTELPFLEATAWPDEQQHLRELRPVLSQLDGRIATVRVLDFGGDKVPPFLTQTQAALDGQARGLPPLLRTPDALGSQLRAALRAGAATRLRILVPMVTSLREVRLAREELDRAVAAVGHDGDAKPELGVMVEVPSAALIAERLASEVEFLSIGTNDLTERVLGVHRRDPGAKPALAAHPTVITLINRVVRAGAAHGVPVGVCGEAAGDPLVLPLLVGIGVSSVSVSPSRVDEVRARVRRLDAAVCRQLVRSATRLDSVEAVWDLVRDRAFPEIG
ncbi:MAG TPA: putative PEP-binding protein [Actinomycetota bacterium]|nr:putative PEP-binding protein [Actinomycetota bacterium]